MIDCRQFQAWLDDSAYARVIELREPSDAPNDSAALLNHELDPIFEHLAACTACSRDWQDAQEAWLVMASGLDPLPVDPEVELMIMNRISSASASHATITSSTKTPSSHDGTVATSFLTKAEFRRYAFAASILALLVAYVVFRPVASRIAGSPPTAEELLTIEKLAGQMDRLDELQQVFGSPELRFVSFQSTAATPKVQGYIVYDLVSREGHFFGFDLVTTSNQSYKLSLLNESGKVVTAAVIDVNGEKQIGAAVIKLPVDARSLKEAVVTIEDGVDVPATELHSGHIVMRTEIALLE